MLDDLIKYIGEVYITKRVIIDVAVIKIGHIFLLNLKCFEEIGEQFEKIELILLFAQYRKIMFLKITFGLLFTISNENIEDWFLIMNEFLLSIAGNKNL
jgi:hypothetical protein